MANWNSDTLSYDNQSTRFEVMPVANSSGVIFDNFPVTITGYGPGTGGGGSDFEYKLKIAKGEIPGYRSVFVQGYNPSFANGTEESFWGGSTIYPWTAWNTPGTLSLVSTQNDTGDVTIVGLDANFDEITEVKTLTGTVAVTTANTFARINAMYYSDGSVNAGNISASRGGTVVGSIRAGTGAAQSAQYTVPAGYTAYVLQGIANIGKGNDGIGHFRYRQYNSTFQYAFTFLLYESSFGYSFDVPIVLPEKTDFDVTLTASNSGTAASCAYGILLIQNS